MPFEWSATGSVATSPVAETEGHGFDRHFKAFYPAN